MLAARHVLQAMPPEGVCLCHGIIAMQVPCATTLCIVALGAGEARVEALASEFVQLREVPADAAAAPDGAGGDAEMADLFLFDDDDTYQVPHDCRPRPGPAVR